MTNVIAVAGGGASGVIAAAHLLRESPGMHVALFEPATPGLGVAYGTTCPLHLLNVPAAAMSAFAGNPLHFLQWLAAKRPGEFDASSFVPRFIYGQYLRDVSSETAAAYGERFVHVAQPVQSVEIEAGRVLVRAGSTRLSAAALILATGAGKQAEWPGAPVGGRYCGNPWLAGALVPRARDERVLILGSGLSAVDAVLGLRHNGHRGPVRLLSRRGLLPHEHRLFDAPPLPIAQHGSIRALLRLARKHPGADWRAAIDGLRPHTNDLWRALPVAERRRFLRHLLPYWNVHRHRMAPEAAAQMAQLFATGAASTIAGRVLAFEAETAGIRVRIRERGAGQERTMVVDRIINCSGTAEPLLDSSNALLQSLLTNGLLRPAAAGNGIDVAPDGALIAANGFASHALYAIGPPRFGTALETTAIPEIRTQAADLAHLLCARTAGSVKNKNAPSS